MKEICRGQAIRWVLGLLIAAPIVMMTLDLPVSRWCFTHQNWGEPWNEFRRWLMLSEIFGHAWGAVLAGFAVYLLDPARRHVFFRLVFAVFAAGIAPNLVKLVLVRYRPRFFLDDAFPGAAENIRQTFGGFPTAFLSGLQGFPSGHSALACATAVVLIRLYPRGKILFAALAALVMIQRVVASAHFPSDTLIGAAMGIFVATLCMPRETILDNLAAA